LANPEHVAIAKRRTFAIARWRAREFQSRPRLDLSGAYLSGIKMPGVDLGYDDLTQIDLTSADLRHANFVGARLRGAHLSRCNLNRANFADSHAAEATFLRSNLRGSNLDNADLRGADLSNCDIAFATLVGANLAGADLTEADLTMADLTGANLSGAKLSAACLDVANLTRCDLRRATLVRTRLDRTLLEDVVLDMTLFADCDLSAALGLETLRHDGPSMVGADTLARSNGGIPESFLRPAGVPPEFIDSQAGSGDQTIPHRRVLLIGSVADDTVVRWLETELRSLGLQCWSLLADDEEAAYNTSVIPPMSRFKDFDRVALLCSRGALESPACWRLYQEIMQRQATSAARRSYVAALAMDDCLDNDGDELYRQLKGGPTARLRARKDRVGGYRRDLPGVLTTLTAEIKVQPDIWDDEPEDGDAEAPAE
jgi:uncharacterized protein YjbI with pentapeptide repeats